MLSIPQYELDYCYDMGVDCEINGANETNCHFAIFVTREKMLEWERGKIDAKKMIKKENKNQ